MILDGHIHAGGSEVETQRLLRQCREAGVDGGVILSQPPATADQPEARLTNVLAWCQGAEHLYPFFWIDPMAADAKDQVALAVARGIVGFKVICGTHSPGEAKALETFAAIAAAGKPILFHSGILWDGRPSSIHNRPAAFEALMDVPGLRFALAHISWPWCDELIAVYGKFLNAHNGSGNPGLEMFVDITPGTPPIYRREALTKLYTVGYDVEHNVLFGTDCNTDCYNAEWARQWQERDNGIYAEIGLTPQTISQLYAENLKRFLGLSTVAVTKKLPKVGE